MPYMSLQTNIEIDNKAAEPLLKALSATVSEVLGKPESYVMIALNSGTPMTFGGNTSPTAYIELKSLGLPQENTPGLSKVLCGVIAEETGIQEARIYIEFAAPDRHMWGWDGRTF